MRGLDGSVVLLRYGLKEDRGVLETVQWPRRIPALPEFFVIRLRDGGFALIERRFQVEYLVRTA